MDYTYRVGILLFPRCVLQPDRPNTGAEAFFGVLPHAGKDEMISHDLRG